MCVCTCRNAPRRSDGRRRPSPSLSTAALICACSWPKIVAFAAAETGGPGGRAAFSSFASPSVSSPKILRLKRPFFGRLNCNCNRRRRERSKEDRPTDRRPPTKTESGLPACPTASEAARSLAAADDKTSICRHTYSTKSERHSLRLTLAIKRALYPPSLALPLAHTCLLLFPLHRYRRPLHRRGGSHRVRALVVRAATVVRPLVGWLAGCSVVV